MINQTDKLQCYDKNWQTIFNWHNWHKKNTTLSDKNGVTNIMSYILSTKVEEKNVIQWFF